MSSGDCLYNGAVSKVEFIGSYKEVNQLAADGVNGQMY